MAIPTTGKWTSERTAAASLGRGRRAERCTCKMKAWNWLVPVLSHRGRLPSPVSRQDDPRGTVSTMHNGPSPCTGHSVRATRVALKTRGEDQRVSTRSWCPDRRDEPAKDQTHEAPIPAEGAKEKPSDGVRKEFEKKS